MLGIFEQTPATETALYPHEDPEVLRLQASVDAAQIPATHAQEAFSNYLAAHWEDVVRVPWPREKQALSDRRDETAQTLAEVERARDLALAAATERAKEAWNARILDQLRDDDATITACIDLLDRHERLVDEASRAGVRGVHKVSELFITSTELAARFVYTKKALALD